ncbi:MAG: hypothetical protein NUW21_07090, partial [Elusimicrobia bacterium]|nr:hypothetical protein [Elusimicrobiota bacterium]
DPGMAFVLVPHLSPLHKSHLPEILSRGAKLPIGEARAKEKILPNRIYVVPSNRAMHIREGVLHLSATGRKADWRNPIDSFFRSLASDQGGMAIGVLLSGAGSDGTEGLRAIKDGGGATYAQDGDTAAHRSMPQSAAVSGCVDFILSPSAIGAKLAAGGRYGRRSGEAQRSSSLERILTLLRAVKGIDFSFYKMSTLRRRVQRRMNVARVSDAEKYLRALKADPRELDLLFGDILISVTSFFREPESFQALKTAIYPRLLKNRASGAPIRLWIPGCSTGEEAYSHAINLVEFLGKDAARVPIQIFATDVNPAVIAKARAGRYTRKMTDGVSAERLRRFFVETSDGYRISPALRERCVFAAHNLVQDPPFTNLDLISCRNLLIYMGPALQEKALQIFQYALKPRGILMLGRSETIGDFSGRFLSLNTKRKVFSERTEVSKAPLDFHRSSRFLEAEASSAAPAAEPAAEAFDLQGSLDGVMPARYVPNGVVVNTELEIVRFLGNSSAYLQPAPGKSSLNLRRMAAGEFLLELRSAVLASKRSAAPVRKEIAAPHPSGEPRRVRLEVLPIRRAPAGGEYFLILFEELAVDAAAPKRRPKDG